MSPVFASIDYFRNFQRRKSGRKLRGKLSGAKTGRINFRGAPEKSDSEAGVSELFWKNILPNRKFFQYPDSRTSSLSHSIMGARKYT
ncbi:MAG: hypothetical protein ABH865_09585 [Candidatus Omnitrophota bacterium]|nr:hypothetical protein [Candidatus Omnitrophota bacterium]